MQKSLVISESVPVLGHYDVIVAGGGVAGVAAAIAARKQGKSVLLIEKGLKLGGLATMGLINLFVPMCNGRGKQIIFGMAEEMLRRSIQYGYDTIPPAWQNGEPEIFENDENPARYLTRFSAEIFALDLTEWVCEVGVELLFDTVVTKPLMEGNHCKGIIVENKSGRGFYESAIVIDATGDADILYRAGVPTVQGSNYFTYYGTKIDLIGCERAIKSGRINDVFSSATGGNASLYGHNHPDDMPLFSGTTAQSVNEYVILGQKKVLDNIKNDERFSRDIVTLPSMVQFRTTRHIDGDYTLSEEDAYKHHYDSIGAICDFDRRDLLFEVPFRTLYHSDFDNLITAGRTASAKGYAWDILRVIPPAIITGQAAGIAASMAIDSNCAISKIDITKLQDELERQDVIVKFDDALVPNKTKVQNVEHENNEESAPIS